MESRYEVEVTLSLAKDLKNVNWRNGPLKPYVVLWVDPKAKCSTVVDRNGDTCPTWDETLVIPLYAPINESTLFIDVVHALNDEEEDRDTKPLIGSARISLSEVVDEVGFGDRFTRSLRLKRPSGRPHGKVEVKVCVKDPRYRAPDPYYAPPGSREYSAPAPYGNAYGGGSPPRQQQPIQYYSYNEYGAPAPSEPQYGGQSTYGHAQQVEEKKKEKSKYGMGTGLAVGVVAGALGGIAIMEGMDYVENKIAGDVEERIEEEDCDDSDHDHDHYDHDVDNHYDDDDHYDNDD